MKPSARSARNPRGGSAFLELAVMLPVLVLLMLGATDFGRVFFDAMALAGAARAGAGYGARPGKTADYAGMRQAALNDAIDVQGVTATAERYCQCSSGTTVVCSSNCVGENKRIFVRVTVQKTFKPLASYPGIPSPVNLVGRALFRAQ